MVDTDREDWLDGGMGASGLTEVNVLSLSSSVTLYSLAEPLACELALSNFFGKATCEKGKWLPQRWPCSPPNFHPALEFGLSTNKEPCCVTCFLALCKAGIRASPFSHLHSRVMIVQCCPPAARCFLCFGFVIHTNATLLLLFFFFFSFSCHQKTQFFFLHTQDMLQYVV